MPLYYDSDDQPAGPSRPSPAFFRRRSPFYSYLGGGRVGDIMLWRSKVLSAGILGGFTATWFLFEIVELHFVTLASYVLISVMLFLFTWAQTAPFFRWRPPTTYDIRVSESTGRYVLSRVNKLMITFYTISCGYDLPSFFVALASLFILAIAGSYSTALNVIYTVFLCLMTIPILYERYEREVHYIATRGRGDMRRFYNKLDAKVLSKIPRGPVKNKKFIR